MKEGNMNAIVANGYGNYKVLEYKSVKKPTLKSNEVLVEVFVSSATRADTMMLTGTPYIGRLFTGLTKPKDPIPGTGFSGVISAIGSDVTKFNIGDKVFGETTLGFSTNAEFVSLPEDGVILHKPENLPHIEAASYCDGALTSINFLKEVSTVKPGDKVLINGASGSLGTAAVQIAKIMGAEVTGVCSSSNLGLVKSLGADFVIDYKKQDFTETDDTYDIIYDTVGKSNFSKAKKVLTKDGLYISPVLKFSLLLQMMWTSVFGSKKAKFNASGLKTDDELKSLLKALITWYKEGKLKMIVDRQFPLEKVAEAHQYIAQGHKKGNVVIVNSNQLN